MIGNSTGRRVRDPLFVGGEEVRDGPVIRDDHVQPLFIENQIPQYRLPIRRWILTPHSVRRIDRLAAVKREQALTTLAALVGAQVIARALDDPELSQEVLQAVRKKLR